MGCVVTAASYTRSSRPSRFDENVMAGASKIVLHFIFECTEDKRRNASRFIGFHLACPESESYYCDCFKGGGAARLRSARRLQFAFSSAAWLIRERAESLTGPCQSNKHDVEAPDNQVRPSARSSRALGGMHHCRNIQDGMNRPPSQRLFIRVPCAREKVRASARDVGSRSPEIARRYSSPSTRYFS